MDQSTYNTINIHIYVDTSYYIFYFGNYRISIKGYSELSMQNINIPLQQLGMENGLYCVEIKGHSPRKPTKAPRGFM